VSEQLRRAALRTVGPVLPVAVLFAVLIATSTSAYSDSLAATFAVNVIVLVGLNLVVGHAGQLSLGHASLVGIGAYVVAVATADHGLPSWLSVLLAVLVSALVAGLIGLPTLRLKGLYFAVATLAFGVIVTYFLDRAKDLTGGPDGKAVPALEIGGTAVTDSLQIAELCAVVAVLVLLGERLFVRTWVGWTLRAARSSEPGAASVGMPAFSARLGTFVLSGAVAGLGGALLAWETSYISPTSFTLDQSIDLFVVLFVGGAGTFIGPIAGAAILYGFDRWLTPYPDARPYVLGLLFLAFLRFFPGGIGGGLRRLVDRLRSARERRDDPLAPASAPAPPEPRPVGAAAQGGEPA
jgi:branched-chain amino acid transport system permease protein